MNIIEDFLTPNKWSRPQKKLEKVLGIVLHWVANPKSTDKGNRNFFENRKYGKTNYGSAHYIVGLNGEKRQCLPLDEMAYHVGSNVYTARALERLGSYPNNSTIGIECTHLDWDGNMSKETYESTLELAVYLLKKFNLTENDLWLHKTIVGWKDCHRYFVNNNAEWVKFKTQAGEMLRGKAELNPEVDTKDMHLVEADADGMYTIKRGDTYWGISQALDIDVADLRKLNPKVDEKNLKIGQKIRVEEVDYIEHKVKKDDTLWDLARDYKTTVDKIEQLNKGIKAKALQIGQIVKIPSAKSASKPAPTPPKKPAPAPAKPTPKPPVEKAIGSLTVTAFHLNVRASASFNAKIVDVANRNEKFQVYEHKNGMYRIGNGKWVSANNEYVRFISAGKRVQVVVGNLNVRASASFESKIVDVAKLNETFNILEEKNGMYRIGHNQWISANTKYVRKV